MIIDFHTHIFPDTLAPRALAGLSENSGNMTPECDGTLSGMLGLMDRAGVSRAVLLNIATNEKQMRAVNDFAIANNCGRFNSFGSVFPFSPDACAELERLAASGVKGIKLHPEYQDFFVDDDRMGALYDKINALGLICVFHAGRDNAFGLPVKASPERFDRILGGFRVPVVLAHFGGYIMWEQVARLLCGRGAYFDTSFCFSNIPLPAAKELVMLNGAEHILFGSDAPWSDPARELRLIDAIGLDEDEKAAVLYKNAAKLLALSEDS